jgi:predicted peptidase
MRLKSIILTLLGSFITVAAVSQENLFSKEVYKNNQDETLLYRQMVSDYAPDTKYPLVIFLHGSGERGSDNTAQLLWGVQNFATSEVMKIYQPIVIAPQCPEESSWANIDYKKEVMKESPTKTMKLLIELIEKKIDEMPIDKDRIYVTGLSMGGFGTYELLARRPDLFAAAVPVCGAGDLNRVKDFAHIPLWLFHGANDDVVDSRHSRQMVAALHEAGANPGYTQYPETGHFSWIAAYSDPMMMAWLFRQSK